MIIVQLYFVLLLSQLSRVLHAYNLLKIDDMGELEKGFLLNQYIDQVKVLNNEQE